MSGQQPGRDKVFKPLEGDDPRTVAGYQLAAKLGAGGMGKVYLSYTPGGRPIAIKVIRPDFSQDAEFRRRFAQEVKSAQRVQGLYTAPVIDADTEGSEPWLATAYVPGPSLADAVAEHGALPVEAVALLIAGMAEALHVIHGAGIVHRDLKPSNVLLAADGPRVIDFGIAYAADATSLTGSGVTIGTPSFMAPEQAAGRKVTAATDIFALGQVAVYAATGTPAFGEGTSHGVLYRIVHEEPDISGVPERLRELVTRCLAKDPAARPTVPEVIALCQSANAETVLRRPEDWLPGAVAADITGRNAAPAPPAYVPTQPVQPATPPPGYGPAPTHQPPTHQPPAYQPGPQTPAPLHHTPTQLGAPPTYPGQPQPSYPQQYQHPQEQAQHQYPTQLPQPTPPVPAKGKRKGKGVAIALAAALIFGIAGGGTAYVLLKDNNKGNQAQEDPAPKAKPTPKGGGGGEADPAKSPDAGASSGSEEKPTPTPVPDPEPADFKDIDLTAGYHLTFSDDVVRPQPGEDGAYELAYDTGGYLDSESEGGTLALLDPGQPGSLEACRAETRFTESIYTTKLSKGRQVCVTTGTGHIGLVTVQGFSPEDSPSDYMSLDLTVWRNAAAAAAASN
ncbi:protein kinase [Streptomyces sp. 21So2-11]|uniref:serine/threonine protein kinase n=1 Tax=Streptomyces sp. 21So2-11 TaxID=3144408 RepID=UPI003219C486